MGAIDVNSVQYILGAFQVGPDTIEVSVQTEEGPVTENLSRADASALIDKIYPPTIENEGNTTHV